MQDYEIIKLCMEGKKEHFEILVDRYQKLVYSLAISSLHDPQLAEDAAQEAFVKAYIHLGSYNPEYRFSTWLSRIVMNTCTDMLRKRKESLPIDEAFDVSDKEPTPEEKAMSRERKSKLEELVSQLEPKYRQPLLLYHLSGMKYDQIAQYLKVPMSIVKNRIFRARKMLKEQMEGY